MTAPPPTIPRFRRIKELLRERFRQRVGSRITDENTYELAEAVIDGEAFVGHLLGVLLEVGLDQSFASEASLIGPMLRNASDVGLVVGGYSPAKTDIIAKLNAPPTASGTLAVKGNRFATDADAEGIAVVFAASALVPAVDIRLFNSRVANFADPTTYADITTEMRSLAGSTAAGLPAVPSVADRLEVSIPYPLKVSGIDVDVTVAAVTTTVRWCYWNGGADAIAPIKVETAGMTGSDLKFTISLPDGWGPPAGLQATANLRRTGVNALGTLVASGSVYTFQVTGHLGQSSPPSTDPADYIVQMDWVPFPNVTDDTSSLTALGVNSVSWDLPDEIVRNADLRWRTGRPANRAELQFTLAAIVVTATGSPTAPTLESIQTDTATAYAEFAATQGSVVGPVALGTTDGTADQEFTFGTGELLFDGAVISVDEGSGAVEWTSVDHLLSSDDNDEHVVVARNPDDVGGWIGRFGDDVNGRIPTAASPVTATYAVDGDIDGNVGKHQVTVNADGVADFTKVWNPGKAAGWQEAPGASDQSKAELREKTEQKPRIKHAPITLPDYEVFAEKWRLGQIGATRPAGVTGTPVARAFARMHGTDDKVIVVVVVGGGGNTLDSGTVTDLDAYFNDPDEGVVLTNYRVSILNYTPRAIDLTMTVTRDGDTYTGLDPQIGEALKRYLNADSSEIDETGTERKRFEPGGEVCIQKIPAWLEREFPTLRGARFKVTITVPAADVALGDDELPTSGTHTINGVAYS